MRMNDAYCPAECYLNGGNVLSNANKIAITVGTTLPAAVVHRRKYSALPTVTAEATDTYYVNY